MIRTVTYSPVITEANRRQLLRDRRRAALEGARKQRRAVRSRRTNGLRDAVQTVAEKPKAANGIEVPIHALGAMVEVAGTFTHRGAMADAAKLTETTLAVLLRQYWVLVSGRENANPKLENIALKLYQRSAIDKQSLRLLRNLTDQNDKPARPHETLAVCRILLDLVKAELIAPSTEAQL